MIRKIIFVGVMLILSAGVFAENKSGWNFDTNISMSSNGKGLTGGEIGASIFNRQYIGSGEDILFKNNKIDMGIENLFTPTSNETMAYINYEPIAFFDISVKAGYTYMYKALGYGFYTFQKPDEKYDGETLKNLKAEDRFGYRIVVAPTLKFKYQNFIAVNATTINMMNMNYDGYYLNWRSYAIEKGQDMNYSNSTYLLYEMNKCMTYGLTYDYSKVPTSTTGQRISLMCALKPSVLKESDGYLVGFLGKDLVANEPYIAVRAGFGGGLF